MRSGGLSGARSHYNAAMSRADVVTITLRLPRDVHAQFLEVAKEQRRSLNAALVVAVERYIRQLKARQPKEAQDAR
jgi:hypothetical protein